MKPQTNAQLAQAADGAIRVLLEAAYEIAIKEVERRVRYALARHKGWTFCMGMGSSCFHGPKGEVEYDRRWMQPTIAFINEYDRDLHISGYPMKIETADGPLITNW